jgi:hypothetical protein
MQTASATAKATFRRLKNTKPALFVCDVQEKFRPRIHQMDHVIHTSKFMVRSRPGRRRPPVLVFSFTKSCFYSRLMLQRSLECQLSLPSSIQKDSEPQVPCLVFPAVQGDLTHALFRSKVAEIKELMDEQSCKLFPKTRFSMLTPEARSCSFES